MGRWNWRGDGPDRIYVVEPTGTFEDDPNLTDKKFPAIRRSRIDRASRCASWVNIWIGRDIRQKRSRR